MRVLAIDTALGACAACIFESGADEPIAAESIAMERGHAEALLPLLDRVVSRVEGGFASLDRVVVTIGPGSFTGLRVGISAARAVGIATGVPVVGVTTLSALMAPLIDEARSRLIVAAIDARNDRVYAQALAPRGRLVIPPSVLAVKEVVRALGSGHIALVGSGAPLIASEAWSVGLDARVYEARSAPDIAWVARLGAAAHPAEALAKPYYLLPPDARPQDGARIARR